MVIALRCISGFLIIIHQIICNNVENGVAILWKNCLQLSPKSTAKHIPRYSILKKQGYIVVIVEKHLIFYKVNEENKTVIIYAIVDGRSEYQNLI